MNSQEALLHFFFTGDIQRNVADFFYSSNRGEAALRLRPLLHYAQALGASSDGASLIVSSAGEISNNSFDHNMGYWRDVPGCCMAWSASNSTMTIGFADRGRGIVSSLQPALAQKFDSQSIMTMAFEEIVTGRAPEVRGNGLKFVRRAIESSPAHSLIGFSNGVVYSIGSARSPVISSLTQTQDFGTLIYTQWELP